MQKKIGPLRLSGLIIGPVLGSGIILLPPAAFRLMGTGAIFAWAIILGLGLVFGYAFTRLSILSPGNEGVSIAIGAQLGPFWRELASNFIISAVCFGPVAVLMTASAFLQRLVAGTGIRTEWIAFILLVFCLLILLKGVRLVSNVTLILSSLTAVLLVSGSVWALLFASEITVASPFASITTFGYTLLLLFWAIIGWEVVGNYVEDVENPRKTLFQGMKIGLAVITGTYLIVALAMQSLRIQGQPPAAPDAVLLLTPLFGPLAAPIIGIIASGLCIATYLMIVGGIARLIQIKAETGRLPAVLMKKTRSGIPVTALLALGSVHLLNILALNNGSIQVETLVATANVFFIGNAVLGLAAAYRILKRKAARASIALLIGSFTLMLVFSNTGVLMLAVGIVAATAFTYRMHAEPLSKRKVG